MSDELLAISPLDGRYSIESESLRDYFSEFAYIRDRVKLEVAYLIALSRDVYMIRDLKPTELKILDTVADTFSLKEAYKIKEFEKITRHDVKAIENYLRTRLATTSLSDLLEFLHFGLTSEDVNNLAQSLELRNSRDKVLLPALIGFLGQLEDIVRRYKSTPMLACTHGQPAVPTTFGKEMAVFYSRLRKQLKAIQTFEFEAKLNGAVGNFSALTAAAPDVDWLAFCKGFINDLELEPNLVTTQIVPYDNWIEYFNSMHLINSILLGLCQDM